LELLRRVGETVYGSYWQKPMTAYLGMSQRHMVRWSNGEWIVPDLLQDGRHLAVVLTDLLEAHQAKVDALRQQLAALLPKGGRPGT
jgi:hypothetical protein